MLELEDKLESPLEYCALTDKGVVPAGAFAESF
jgi:hypothetical protein